MSKDVCVATGGHIHRSGTYVGIVDQIDLPAAMTAVKRNDLLPPRPDDKAGGQVGDRFVAALKHSLMTGGYEPEHAVIVPVTKPKYSTRPAALMNLADRVVFHALVEPLRPRIERGLVSNHVLFWPRATATTEKHWRPFETAPLAASGEYIVRADVSGFYESIDHRLLQQALIKLTGKVDLVDALIDFLGQVMNSPRGLPQGLGTCDVLASAYLSDVDSEMLRAVGHYWRNGDDIRMAVRDYDAGRRAVHLFEKELRSARLLLNADKTRVLHRETYERQVDAVERKRRETQQRILDERQSKLAEAELDEVQELVEKAGIDEQTQFDLLYHHTIEIQDIAEQLRPHLEPDQVEVALATYLDALRRAPGTKNATDLLSDEEFHGIVTSSLTVLLADKNRWPIADAANLIRRFPDKTELLCSYLRGVAPLFPQKVSEAATTAVTSGYLTGWQQAWLFSVLRSVAVCAPSADISTALQAAAKVAGDEDASWLARAEAVRLLAQVGELEHELVIKIWNRGPAAIRGDVAAAVAVTAETGRQAWAEAFRDSLNSDALMQVVLSGVNASAPGQIPSSGDMPAKVE